jgi:uncharacterized protein (TIGR02996 family)
VLVGELTGMNITTTGFWQAMIAEPDDDTHRLILADWLDDHGDSARAEFIRTQCALANLDPDDPTWIDLRIREHRLLHEHRAAWLEECPKWMQSKVTHFRLGFPARLTCTASEYVQHRNTLPRDSLIDELSLTFPSPDDRETSVLDTLAASPHLERLRWYDTNRLDEPVLERLLPRMMGLRELRLTCPYSQRAEDYIHLVCLPALRGLRRLHIEAFRVDGINDAARRKLARADLPDLTSLALIANRTDDLDLASLLSLPFVPRLRRLLVPSPAGSAGIQRLAQTSALGGLRELGVALPWTQGVEECVAALASAPALLSLTTLALYRVYEEVLFRLAGSPLASRLPALYLWPTNRTGAITPSGMQRLLSSGALRNLVRLGIATQNPLDKLIGVLADSPDLPNLTHLILYQTGATPATISLLAKSPHLKALRVVSAGLTIPGNAPQPLQVGRLPVLPEEWWWDQ